MARIRITVEWKDEYTITDEDLRELEDMMAEAVGTWDLPERKIKAERLT